MFPLESGSGRIEAVGGGPGDVSALGSFTLKGLTTSMEI